MQSIVPRKLNLEYRLKEKSNFLLGPRQTGKSTLIAHTLPRATLIDLNLGRDVFDLQRDPSSLEDLIPHDAKFVVIDEIQRIPALLNEVHRLIENRGIHFLLTGSSARKLRGKGVNLLGGRARMIHFHPLIKLELADRFDLERALTFGTLPLIYLSRSPLEDLDAYVSVYLREEIMAEGLTRNLHAFSRVLDVAALCNATIVNFDKISNDSQVPRTTVHEYFRLLQDTLILQEIPAWRQGLRRKPIKSSKFYFFDCGIVNYLLRRTSLRQGTPEFGFAFETWFLHELLSWVHYQNPHVRLSHWRSQTGYEVDFLLDDRVAIEVKAKSHVANHDLKGLEAIKDEGSFTHRVCVCLEHRPRRRNGIDLLPYELFLEQLWNGVYDE